MTRDRPAVSATQEKGTSYTYSAAKNTSVNGAVMYKAPAMGASNDMIAVEEAAPMMMRSMSTADTAETAAQNKSMLIKRVDMTIKTIHFDNVVENIQQLTVGTLQSFLDTYTKSHGGVEVDYIHGEDSLRALAAADGAVGFLFDGMSKDELFKTVIFDGALPRKTFSMGHARDKRYYLECRKIK